MIFFRNLLAYSPVKRDNNIGGFYYGENKMPLNQLNIEINPDVTGCSYRARDLF